MNGMNYMNDMDGVIRISSMLLFPNHECIDGWILNNNEYILCLSVFCC